MKYAWSKRPKRLNKKTLEWATLNGRRVAWVAQKRGRGRIVVEASA